MDQITLADAWKELSSYDPRIWIGVLAAVITFIIEIRLCQKEIIFSKGEKNKRKAIELGHVVQGTRISCHRSCKNAPDNDNTFEIMYTAYYEYQTDGKIGKKRIIRKDMEPPSTLQLYYLDSPHKVFSDYDIGKNPLMLLLYIIPVLAAYMVMKLLGYTG